MSRTPRVALATCRALPSWEVDDAPLVAALAARGAEVARPAWDDPGVDWHGFDACLLRTTWDYTERRDAFLAWAECAATATRLFNPPEVVRWNTHKRYLRELEADGVAIAPTVWLERRGPDGARGGAADLGALLARFGAARAFVKPCVGATARETLRFGPDELAAARAHVDRLLATEDVMLQPYLPSVETEGELSVVFVEGEPTHGVRKRPVAGDYRVQDDFGASDEPWTPAAGELALARAVVERVESRFGRLLYARVDLLRAADGSLLLNELELVEPSLFFRHSRPAAERLAAALLARA